MSGDVLLATGRQADRQISAAAFDDAPVGIGLTDLEGRFVWTNRCLSQLLGYSSDYLLATDFQSLMHPDELEAADNARGEMIAGTLPHFERETRVRHRDGRYVWVNISVSLTREVRCAPKYFIAIAQDVTERKRAEAQVRAKTLLLETEHEASLDGILVVDRAGQIVSFNNCFREMWGIPAQVLDTKSDEQAVQSILKCVADPSEFQARLEHLYEHPTEMSREEIVLVDGRTFDRYSAPMVATDGRPYGRVWFFRDVTERKSAELTLRASEARFRTTFEEAGIGMALVDMTGRCVRVNAELRNVLGYSDEEFASMTLHAFTHPDDQAKGRHLLQELVDSKRSRYQVDSRLVRKDGREIVTRLTVSMVQTPSDDDRYAIGMVEDITERRRLEEHLRQAHKMEAIGRLAGGIAHDFNNLLTAILGYTALVRKALPEGSTARGDLQEVENAANSAALLTGQLLTFSRRSVLEPTILDLNAVIDKLDRMLRRIIGEDVRLELALAGDLGRIAADLGQVEQVIMNLAVNARDAMPDGGTLTLATRNVTLDGEFVRSHAGLAHPGRYVLLQATDTGCGMTPEVMAKVFDPFFTTKPSGQGTGLGLATIYGIVKSAEGHVEVASQPGCGTTFSVYLPRTDRTAASSDREDAPAVPGGTETILLVEDDARILKLVARTMTRLGYTVLPAMTGEEALQIGESHEGPIALVLTDVIMPGLSGPALAERFRASKPDSRVLFASGYPSAEGLHVDFEGSMVDFIRKPYTLDGLARKVRSVLDASCHRP